MTIITQMSHKDARDFFLKHTSYCGFNLPPYFNFDPLLQSIDSHLSTKPNGLKDLGLKNACDWDGVNYIIQTNKDCHYSWRPLQLIHPALYVYLAREITTEKNWQLIVGKFMEFSSNENIICASLPRAAVEVQTDKGESILGWWKDVEQKSLSLALDYKYLFTTDIANFYPSIYTHSISWALHTKMEAKKKDNRQNFNLIGVVVDKTIQHMQNGQTNGIPQGSVLMDFIAELVLAYADNELSTKLSSLKLKNYKVIRYRDDYRVFTNSKEVADTIARQLTLTLQDLGLQLNSAKTNLCEDIVIGSVKPDKVNALTMFSKGKWESTLLKSLMKLSFFSRENPNSGQLNALISDLNSNLNKRKTLKEDVAPAIGVLADLMLRNPKSLESSVRLLSVILRFVEDEAEKLSYLSRIKHKFEQHLGTGVSDLWLQRASHPINADVEYNEQLCQVVSQVPNTLIWESEWITDLVLKNSKMATSFIDQQKLQDCPRLIGNEEVTPFPYSWDEPINQI
ncbi:RNA-directed DNA polymerase [Vibrio alfacsensis]|uniref:RNA-directed DNA polymerase n=1 Tax=Vibrio alfacsensis TaxID=1074311 RepID=UPI004068671E